MAASSPANNFWAILRALKYVSTTPGATQSFGDDGSYTVKDPDGNTRHHFDPEEIALYFRSKKAIAKHQARLADDEFNK